jgi:hypothetical protein
MNERKRAQLYRVHIESTTGTARAEVELRYGSIRYHGSSEASAEARLDEQRLVAEATLAAIQQLVGRQMRFTLNSVANQEVASTPTVLLTTRVDAEGHKELRLGACFVTDGDLRVATARAVLDSANRAIQRFLPWLED